MNQRILSPWVTWMVILTAVACGEDAFITSVSDVDSANALLASGDYAGALAAYDALQSKNPRIAFNRGLALYHLERWEEAVGAFDEARGAKDRVMKAECYVHVGKVHAAHATKVTAAGESEGALDIWKQAVEAYENALLLEPKHPEALELLEIALFYVDPPCRLRNDTSEPNDSAQQSTNLELTPSQEKGATPGEKRIVKDSWLCPDDSDWYSVQLEPGDRLSASVKRTAGPEHSEAAIVLWSEDGTQRLAPDESDTGSELKYTESASGGSYRLHAANPAGDDFGYDLEVSIRPACLRTEDPNEPNDTLSAATVAEAAPMGQAGQAPQQEGQLPPGTVVGRMCADGHDWYVVDLEESESLRVGVQLEATSGTVELTLHDATGEVIASGTQGEKGALGAVAYSRPKGKVYIYLSGDETAEAVYQMTLERIPPCAEREDAAEDNDTLATATDSSPGDLDGQLCPGDPDIYAVDVQDEESVVAHLSGKFIYGGASLSILASDGRVLGTGIPLDDGLMALGPELSQGMYFIKVEGEGDGTYDLKVQVLPPCPEGNDTDETNNVPDDAVTLELPPPPQGEEQPKPTRRLNRICPQDIDWFRIPVTPETPLMVAGISFVHDKSDLQLAEYEADGETVAMESDKSSSEKNGEGVVVPPPDARIPDPTDYLLRIRGATDTTQGFYILSLQQLPPSGEDQQNQQNQQEQQEQQDQQDQQDQNQQQDPSQTEEQKMDRATFEKEMERNDDQEQRNLEAEKAALEAQHLRAPEKDW